MSWKIQLIAALLLPVIVLFGMAVISPTLAHDHEHPELNDWYRGLHAKSGAWCCTGDDAQTAEEWATDHGHYRVKIEGVWVDVPDEAVIDGPNLAQQAKVWPYHLQGQPEVRCFMPGSMT